jgi:hypothetical protein
MGRFRHELVDPEAGVYRYSITLDRHSLELFAQNYHEPFYLSYTSMKISKRSRACAG